MDCWYKYPKTLHFPWSPGLQNDDRMMSMEDVIANFDRRKIVISEKIDGENTSMYSNHIHARSVYSGDHPSRSWVKALHGKIKNDIPKDWRICGENVYAHHSIFYEDLETYFYVFAIYNDQNICLNWKTTLEWCKLLDLTPVPYQVGYLGFDEPANQIFKDQGYECWSWEDLKCRKIGSNEEGYVVRNEDFFHHDDFQKNVAKFVRKGHVQTDQHWMSKPVVKNKLKDGYYI